MHIENNRDHFINLCAYCQCCTILVAVNVTVYVNVTRFPGQNLAVFCAFWIDLVNINITFKWHVYIAENN